MGANDADGVGSAESARGAFPRAKAMLALAAIAGGIALLSAACQSGSTKASSSPTGATIASGVARPEGSAAPISKTATSKAHAGLAACRMTTLAVTVDSKKAGDAAGSTYYSVDFTNTGSAACAMAGYPRVSLVSAADGSGQQIGAAAQRNSQFAVSVVRLGPGGQAHAWLQVAQAGNYPDSACRPETAHGLKVYPPGEARAGYVRLEFPGCAGSSAPLLMVTPVRGDKGAKGGVP